MTLPYLLRVLGPQSYGSIAFAQALIAYGVVVTDYGFTLTAARDISIHRADAHAVARIFWSTTLTKLVLLACSGLILGSIVAIVPEFRKDWPVFAACSTLPVGTVLFPVWYMQGIEKLRQAALIQLMSRCGLTACIFMLVHSPLDTFTAALLISAPLLVSGLIAVTSARACFPSKFYRPALSDIGACLVGGWHIFAGSVSTTLYLQTNAFVLGILADKRAVAYFSVGYSVVLAVQGLASPATQSVYPRLSLFFSETPSLAWRLARNLALVVLPAMAVASILMALFAKPLIAILAGGSFVDAISIVRIMAVLPFMITAASILGPCVMVNLNLSRQLMWIYLSVGVLNVLLLPYLVVSFAAAGAALSLVIAETFGPIAMLAVLWSRRDRLPGRPARAGAV
jgi:PST family polysaccharide transporter